MDSTIAMTFYNLELLLLGRYPLFWSYCGGWEIRVNVIFFYFFVGYVIVGEAKRGRTIYFSVI